jgi:hypothetical protein
MIWILKSVTKFVIVMFLMMIVCTIVWQFVGDRLYDCTDDGFLGFWRPGDWVHFDHGVVYVPVIVHGRSMSDPDTIKAGWSMTGLWCLWFSFVAVSLVISIVVARVPWMRRSQTDLDFSL